jgi:hypothetical protein
MTEWGIRWNVHTTGAACFCFSHKFSSWIGRGARWALRDELMRSFGLICRCLVPWPKGFARLGNSLQHFRISHGQLFGFIQG